MFFSNLEDIAITALVHVRKKFVSSCTANGAIKGLHCAQVTATLKLKIYSTNKA